MKLLLAEDEISMAEAVTDILTYHKFIVDTVYDGADALDAGEGDERRGHDVAGDQAAEPACQVGQHQEDDEADQQVQFSAVEQGRGIQLHHAVCIHNKYAPGIFPCGTARERIQRINIKCDQRTAKLLCKRLCNSLVVTDALGEKVIAYELNQRYGHGGKRDQDDQKVGEYDFPAYGMNISLNPCQ